MTVLVYHFAGGAYCNGHCADEQFALRDRDAFMSLVPRFNVAMNYNRNDYVSVREWRVMDGEVVIFQHVVTLPAELQRPCTADAYAQRDAIDEAGYATAVAWLDENKPGWNDKSDPLAAWNLP